MSSPDLDLDINNYNEQDLETFFKISPGAKVDFATIELKEAQIRELLLNGGHIQSSMKLDLIRFLSAAKNKLVELKKLKASATSAGVGIGGITGSRGEETRYIPETEPRTSELNKRERVQYVYAQNSEFLPGNVNPIKTRVISKYLTIDTRYRGNYFTSSPTDFNFQLPITINRVVSMRLSSFEIPVAFYNISSSNNYLYLAITYHDINDVLIKYAKIFTIPEGNYTAKNFIAVLNQSIRNGITADTTTTDPDEMVSLIQFVYGMDDATHTGNGKSYLTTTSTHTLSVELDFTVDKTGVCDNVDFTTKIGWNLGFKKRQYSIVCTAGGGFPIQPPVFSVGGGGTVFTGCGESDAPVEIDTIHYLYLAIDDFNRNTNDLFNTAFCVSVMSPDIIARIPVKRGAEPMSMILDTTSAVIEPRIYFGPVDIQRMRVRLYDDKGRIVQMNNANFSFCLAFKVVYDL